MDASQRLARSHHGALARRFAAGRARGRRRVSVLPPTPGPGPARAPCAGRNHLHRAAAAPAVSAFGAKRQRAARAPAGCAGLAGQRQLLAQRADAARADLAGAGLGRRPRQPARQAAPQPAGLAGRPVARAAGRRLLAAGRIPGRARATGPAREHHQGQARRRARSPRCLEHPRRRHALLALGSAPAGQAGRQQAGLVHAGRHRGAGRGQPAAGAADRRQARRDGGRFLRRCRRQDAGAGGFDAQHRAPVRLRHVRAPARGAQAPAGAQRAFQRAPGADRPRARRPHQAPVGQDRPRLDRRPVLGLGHAATQSRSEMAAIAQVGG